MSSKYKPGVNQIPHHVTFTVVYWIDVFTRNIYKDIFLESLRYCIKEKGLVVHAYCIMTNHLHLIISTKNPFTISNLVRDIKKFTAVSILKAIKEKDHESRRDWLLWMFKQAGKKYSANKEYQFWQHDYRPIELATNEMIEQRLNYVHNNPVEAGFVYRPEDYVYSSASAYCEREQSIDLVFIS